MRLRWARKTAAQAAGEPDIVNQVKAARSHRRGDKTFHVHLDGYNLLPYLKGETQEWPRREFLYWSDDGDLMALRDDKWKIAFAEQRAEGMRVWSEPLVKLRLPLLFNLRSDPFEKAQHESEYYRDWQVRRIFLLVLAQAFELEALMNVLERKGVVKKVEVMEELKRLRAETPQAG